MHSHRHTRTHTHTYTQGHTRTHTHRHTHTHTDTHSHTHTHTHTHTRTHTLDFQEDMLVVFSNPLPICQTNCLSICVYQIARLERLLNVHSCSIYTLTSCTHTTHAIECTTLVVYLDFVHAHTDRHTHKHT